MTAFKVEYDITKYNYSSIKIDQLRMTREIDVQALQRVPGQLEGRRGLVMAIGEYSAL